MIRVRVFLVLAVACLQMVFPAESLERTYLRLTVTMTDAEGDRLLPGLTKEDFKVFDSGFPQSVEYFSATPLPSSVTILLDMDGSMRLIDLKSSLEGLIDVCNTQSVPDEVSLIGFSDSSVVIKSFPRRIRNINFQKILGLLEERERYGPTGIVAALSLSKERMQTNAKNYNRAVILVTDAEEDVSYSTAAQIRAQIEKMGLRIYAIFFPGSNRLDHGRFHNLVQATGGRYFQISEPSPLQSLVQWILHEMRYQYVIGFTPQIPQFDGGGRSGRIVVKLPNQRLTPGLSVRFTPTHRIGRVLGSQSEP